MRPVLEHKVQALSVTLIPDSNALLLRFILQDQLLEEHESSFVGHFLPNLDL